MKLSPDQIDFIEQMIVESGIKIPTLHDDVLDHLCCAVELGVDNGQSFAFALDASIKDLAPSGLKRLEEQTTFLLNENKIINMKKLIYLSGFIGALCITIGTTFKLLQMPGADELFMAGYPLLLFLFIPAAAVQHFRSNRITSVAERSRVVLGAVSAVTAGVALIFKMLHLQGFDFFFFSAVLLFSAGFLPLLFFTMYKKSVAGVHQ